MALEVPSGTGTSQKSCEFDRLGSFAPHELTYCVDSLIPTGPRPRTLRLLLSNERKRTVPLCARRKRSYP